MAKPLVYLDACIFLRYIDAKEPHHNEAVRWLDEARARQLEIVTSVISIAEVAFSAQEKLGKALSVATERTIDELWKPGLVRIVEVSRFVATEARKIGRRALDQGLSKRVRGADTIHMATALVRRVDVIHTYDSDWKAYEPILGIQICEPKSTLLPFTGPS